MGGVRVSVSPFSLPLGIKFSKAIFSTPSLQVHIRCLPYCRRNAFTFERVRLAGGRGTCGPPCSAHLDASLRFHDLIPYAALKLGLMLVNPTL